jgi:hypothetical protein
METGMKLRKKIISIQASAVEISRARMWLRPGGLVATPGLTAQLEAGW